MDFTEGSTFILEQHLWAIISDPKQSNNEIVIVNITTYRNKGYEDTSCIVGTGEHPFIRRKSYVNYNRSRIVDLSKLQLWLKTGELAPKDCLSRELLEKIRDRAKETDSLPYGVERVLSTQELI